MPDVRLPHARRVTAMALHPPLPHPPGSAMAKALADIEAAFSDRAGQLKRRDERVKEFTERLVKLSQIEPTEAA